jgi:NAD-dependent deacetylase
MRSLADRLAEVLRGIGNSHLVVVTGAGISRASGIATYRGSDPDAVWRSSDVAMATVDYFRRDPVGQWLWYLQRFDSVRGARPNPAHQALVRLESWHEGRGGQFQLVTQNIDTLHEDAGSTRLIKVHGTSDRVRCSRPGCRYGAPEGSLTFPARQFEDFRRDPAPDRLPRCSDCGAPFRAHVLFFDEFYFEHSDYRFAEVEIAAEQADLLVFIGTSFSVGVTDLFLGQGSDRRIPMFSIDPTAERSTWPGLTALQAPAEELLPAVCELLA